MLSINNNCSTISDILAHLMLDVVEDSKNNIIFNPLEGSLELISIAPENIKIIQNNEEVVKILNTAIRILNGEKLGENDKKYKETAHKVTNFYKTEIKELGKKEFIKTFSFILEYLKNQLIDQKIKDYVLKFPPVRKEEVCEIFLKIEEDNGHINDGPDVFRHLMKAIVGLWENNTNLFENINMENLEGNENYELIKSIFIPRLKTLLNTFQDKIEAMETIEETQELNSEIKLLLNQLEENTDFDLAGDLINQQIRLWRHGSKAQKQMARLLYSLNQFFTIAVMQRGTIGLVNVTSGLHCPHALVGLGNCKLVAQPDKRIDIIFSENSVQVKHKVTLIPNNGSNVEIKQFVLLNTSLENLTKWNCKLSCIVSSDTEGRKCAEKIHRIYRNAGMESVLLRQNEF